MPRSDDADALQKLPVPVASLPATVPAPLLLRAQQLRQRTPPAALAPYLKPGVLFASPAVPSERSGWAAGSAASSVPTSPAAPTAAPGSVAAAAAAPSDRVSVPPAALADAGLVVTVDDLFEAPPVVRSDARSRRALPSVCLTRAVIG